MKPGVIAIIVTVLAVVGLGFFQYQQVQSGAGRANTSLSALSTSFSASLNQQDADISQVESLLAVLNQATTLGSLDVKFFESKYFTELLDFYITLRNADNVGRPNPFLGINEGVSLPTTPSSPIILNNDSSTITNTDTTTDTGAQTDQEIIEEVILDPNQASNSFIVNPPESSNSQSSEFECDFENDETCFDQFSNFTTN